MKRMLGLSLSLLLFTDVVPQTPNPQDPPDDIVRITSTLVQVDAVVVDKDDRVVKDLRPEDFEIYENGEKQDIKFWEFINADAPPAGGGKNEVAGVAPGTFVTSDDLTAGKLRRTLAFVVDDITISTTDMARVRTLLKDFVENRMQEGDLVAIVRSVGGVELLQQFTTDKQLLLQAIALLTPKITPFSVSDAPLPGEKITRDPAQDGLGGPDITGQLTGGDPNLILENANDDTTRTFRALIPLTVASSVIQSLRQIPGRKNLVIISGGIEGFNITQDGSITGNVTQQFRQLADSAIHSGVAINTLNISGLSTTGGVAKFKDTPGRSALGAATGASDPENPFSIGFGRGVDDQLLGNSLGEARGQLGLRGLANRTGGVAVANVNDFGEGLNRILLRSGGYYRLAFRPSDKFDGKYHGIKIKVKRSGVRVFAPEGYNARQLAAPKTDEDKILAAAQSPLAKRDLDVSANLLLRYLPDNKAALDVHVLVNASTLQFAKSADNTFQNSFDVVGIVVDQYGRSRGGFNQTVNANLQPDTYQKALQQGVSYSANAQVSPGFYQIRVVVRENGTGRLGTLSRYFEVPDLAKNRLAAGSLLLYAVNPANPQEPPEPLLASPRIARTKDLRYALVVHNAKSEGKKTQLRTQLMVSQNGKILFQEPEQPLEAADAKTQPTRIGQLGLSKVRPGKYLLTLVVTDMLADKKAQKIARSAVFVVE